MVLAHHISKNLLSCDFVPLGDHHLGGNLDLLLRPHDRGPNNIVTASKYHGENPRKLIIT